MISSWQEQSFILIFDSQTLIPPSKHASSHRRNLSFWLFNTDFDTDFTTQIIQLISNIQSRYTYHHSSFQPSISQHSTRAITKDTSIITCTSNSISLPILEVFYTAMVGVKTWSDDQIHFILTSKSGGMKVQEIITQCKQRWPKKEFKDTGVRYVITNYGKDPEYGYAYMSSTVSNWCSFQSGATSRQSENKSRPRGRVPLRPRQKGNRHLARPSSSPHTNPQHIITLRTKPSATHSPSIPQNNYAAGMREVAGGPIQATFTSPQPLQVLTSQVDSQARTLAHAQQAQDIGITSILRGAEVAPQSPKDKITMERSAPPSRDPQGGASIHNNMAQQEQNTMGYGPPIVKYRGPFRGPLFDGHQSYFVDADDRPIYPVRNNNPNLPTGMNGIAGLDNPNNIAHSAPHQMLPPPQPYQAQRSKMNRGMGTFSTQQPPHQLPTRGSTQLPTQESCPIDPALSNQYPQPPLQSPQSGYQPSHMPQPQMFPHGTMPQLGTGSANWTNNTNQTGSFFTSPTQVNAGQSMLPAQHSSVGMFKAGSYGPPAHPPQPRSWGPNQGISDFRSQFPSAAQQLNQSGMRHNDGMPMSRSTPAFSVRKSSWPAQFFNIDTNDGWTLERVNGVNDPTLLARLSSSGKELGPGVIFYYGEKSVTAYMPDSMVAMLAEAFGRGPAHANTPRPSKAAEANLNNSLGSGTQKSSLPEMRGMASSSKEQPKVDQASGKTRATSEFATLYPPKPAPQSILVSTPSTQSPLTAPPQANSVLQPALQVATQHDPQQEVVNQGTSHAVSNNASVQQNVAPSMQLSPQLLSSHSIKAHNRTTVKRKGPYSPPDDESSPSKRRRAGNHNAQVGNGPSQPMQPDDPFPQFPSEGTMSSNLSSGLHVPAGSNVPNGSGDSAEGFQFPKFPPMSMLPQASGNMDNRQFNPTPSGPLFAPFLMNSPHSSQLFQHCQARSSVGPPMPPSGVTSQVATQSEPQKEQAEDQDGQNKNGQSQYNDGKNNNYRSEQTHADDDIFKQFTNFDKIYAENSSEQV